MKNKLKRIVSMVAVFAMLLSAVPTNAMTVTRNTQLFNAQVNESGTLDLSNLSSDDTIMINDTKVTDIDSAALDDGSIIEATSSPTAGVATEIPTQSPTTAPTDAVAKNDGEDGNAALLDDNAATEAPISTETPIATETPNVTQAPATDAEKVKNADEELLKLGFDITKSKVITSNMNLPTDIQGAKVVWESDNTSWLTSDGQIVQQPSKSEGNKEVNLAATITSGNECINRVYTIVIKASTGAKAYPGAQGYGTQTRGGAGGYIVHVTTLAAEGKGSLKEALEDKVGPRIIVFDVGGTIDLTSLGRELQIKDEDDSNITIAGQTAPGEGIQLKGYGITVNNVSDVIIRYIAIRIGDVRKAGDTYQADPLSVSGNNKKVVLDHLSLSWGVDMGFRVYGSEITMSNCMVSKGLYWNTPHEKGKHNYAGMFAPKYGSFYNNYIADCGQRAPRIIDNEYIDVRNNVVYNSKYTFDICNYEWMGLNAKFNIINNMVLKGSTAPGGSTSNTTSNGSYKYFQGRTYSGGLMTYSVNNLDNTKGARPSLTGDEVTGALWTGDYSDTIDTSKNTIQGSLVGELGMVTNSEGAWSNIGQSWRDMVMPSNISLSDYDLSNVSKQGNTLLNYPLPAPDMITRSPEDAAKWVLTHAGSSGSVIGRGMLDNRYLAEARTRLLVLSDYSRVTDSYGIKLNNNYADKTAYGLPVQVHTIYEDKNGTLLYDKDGETVTADEAAKMEISEQYKFVSCDDDRTTMYVKDTDDTKYFLNVRDYEDGDGLYDGFEVINVDGTVLEKPSPYVSDNDSSDGKLSYKLNGSTKKLCCSEWGDGPGNYDHDSSSSDGFNDPTYVDTEWTEEDWPMLPETYRDSKFDTNRDGVPDFYIELMGWNKRSDYDPNADISRLDYEGRGYTNIEYYINDYCAGDQEADDDQSSEPVKPENVRDGSSQYNTHRSHEILFNTVRRTKAKVYVCEGSDFNIDNATEYALNKTYNVNDDNYSSSDDFQTYYSVIVPKAASVTDVKTSLKANTTYSYKIKTYSDSGVEYLDENTYTFTTEPESTEKPSAPRIMKYVPFNGKVTLTFEPGSEQKSYKQFGSTTKPLTTISAAKYDKSIDHYVLRYSDKSDFPANETVTININGNQTSYVAKGLINNVTYYFDLRAVNAEGEESDTALYNNRAVIAHPDILDKDGNPTYSVDKVNVVGNEVKEYYYDTAFSAIGLTPTKYAINEEYEKEIVDNDINIGDTSKFISYFADVKDWYIYTLGGLPIPAEKDGQKMLLLRDNNHSHSFDYYKKFDSPLEGKSTIHCKLMICDEENDPMNSVPEFRFVLQQDNSESDDTDADTDSSGTGASFGNLVSLTFSKNDINYNGDAIGRYVDDKWYDIKILCDGDNGTCDIYVNDSLLAGGLEYVDTRTSNTIAKWELKSRLSGTEDVYVQYMYAYSGWEDDGIDDGVEEGTSGKKPSGGGGGGSPIVSTESTPTPIPSVKPTEKPNDNTETKFVDLDSVTWAVPAISYLESKGYVQGVDETHFGPDDSVTRAQFITMLMRSFELIGEDAKCNFTDVKSGDWYYNAIAVASAMGVVKGYEDGSFGINDKITRQDMAVMALRLEDALGKKLPSSQEYKTFTDEENIAEYAKDAVVALYESEIINGMGDGSFAPTSNASRAQAAKIIYGLITIK